MSYLGRQLVTSALALNALRPLPGRRLGVPGFFAGWLTTELAPHVLAETAVDTALQLRGGHPAHAALGLVNIAAFAHLTRQGRNAHQTFESALVETLGSDTVEALQERHGILEWTTPLPQLVWPFRMPAPDVEVTKDVAFRPEHGARGLLDVYRPKEVPERCEGRGAPVLLQVHGGAWRIGTKDQQGLPLMKHMASRGWVCVAPNYRLAPRDPFPAHIIDVKRAIAWIREHVHEYGGDPDFIAITGGSAGGHLAALAALSANDPEYQPGFEDAETSLQAAVPFYGIYDMAAATGTRKAHLLRDRFLAPRVFFADPASDPRVFEQASPLLRVHPEAPPFYVLHGVNDSLVDVDQARAFVAALREASPRPVAYTELAGTQHAFDIFPSLRSQHSVRSVETFLQWAYDDWRGASSS